MENKNINSFSSIPRYVQQYMMSFCDDGDLLTLRLVDKSMHQKATNVMKEKIENQQITMSNSFFYKVMKEKIDICIPKKGLKYKLSYPVSPSKYRTIECTSGELLNPASFVYSHPANKQIDPSYFISNKMEFYVDFNNKYKLFSFTEADVECPIGKSIAKTNGYCTIM